MKQIVVAVAVAGSLALAGCAADSGSGGASSGALAADRTSVTTASVPANMDGCVSAEEFGALRDGMSFDDALTILGGNGEKLSESNLADYHTVMYSWVGCGGLGANMNAMFQNGSLVEKAQFGLRATGQAPVRPTTTTTTTTPAQAAAAAAAQKKAEADAVTGGCRYRSDAIPGTNLFTVETSRAECRDTWHGTFVAGMTDKQVDAENDARQAQFEQKLREDSELGGCPFSMDPVGPYTDYTSRGECRDTWHGTFVPGMTAQQVEDENMARIKEQYPARP